MSDEEDDSYLYGGTGGASLTDLALREDDEEFGTVMSGKQKAWTDEWPWLQKKLRFSETAKRVVTSAQSNRSLRVAF